MHRSRWDVSDFQEIPAGFLVPPDESAGLDVQGTPSTVCPVVPLPSTMAEFESRLTPKFRHNLRNARNRLLKTGATLETAAPEQDDEYLDALFRLHAARWNARGGGGVLSSTAVQEFLRSVCHGFRMRGWLRLHGVRYGARLGAVVCIFCAARRSFYYIGGFDPAYSRDSPGNVLNGFAIEQAIAEGCTEFDFLRQGERYKYAWGARDRLNMRLRIRATQSETSATPR
jgi:CelD/BcsL family acetyltransferase involved in cellulose biosynthesis